MAAVAPATERPEVLPTVVHSHWKGKGRCCQGEEEAIAVEAPPPPNAPLPQSWTWRRCATRWTSRGWPSPPTRRALCATARRSPTAPRVRRAGDVGATCPAASGSSGTPGWLTRWGVGVRAVAGGGTRSKAAWCSVPTRLCPARPCCAEFRRGVAPDVLREVTPLLKSYQEEVDRWAGGLGGELGGCVHACIAAVGGWLDARPPRAAHSLPPSRAAGSPRVPRAQRAPSSRCTSDCTRRQTPPPRSPPAWWVLPLPPLQPLPALCARARALLDPPCPPLIPRLPPCPRPCAGDGLSRGSAHSPECQDGTGAVRVQGGICGSQESG